MPLNDNVKGLSPNDPEPGINKSSTVNSLSPLDAEASLFFPVGTLNELNPDAKFFIPSNQNLSSPRPLLDLMLMLLSLILVIFILFLVGLTLWEIIQVNVI